MTIKFTNNAAATLASDINSSVTSLSVSTGQGGLFPTLSGADYFYATIANTTGTVEIVKVTARSTDTFTIVRAQDNTLAAAWTTGDKVELRPTAAVLTAMAQTANNLSDLASASTARTNLGVAIGTDVQAYDADLAAIASSGKGAEIASYGTYGVGFKNRIINGAMMIDQRNAGASVTPVDNQYTVDRWQATLSQSAKYTTQQNAGSVTPPVGFANYLGLTVGASANVTVGASDYFMVQQKIEGFNTADLAWGTASASPITLSFWVRSSLTGTFGGSIANGVSFNRSYPFTYAVSSANTWEQKTITIAGDTSGSWSATNGATLVLRLSIGMGSSNSGTAGAWAAANYSSATGATNLISTNNATFQVTGVQLEVGTVATSFDYRPYGTELALCQRYYEKSFEMGTAPAQNTGSYNGTAVASSPGQLSGMSFGDTRFKVNKRASPTITFFNPAAANAFARDQNAGVNCSATSAWVAGESSFAITASTGAGSGATNRVGVHWTAQSEL